MGTFRDSNGLEWLVGFTVYDARRCKQVLGLDLLDSPKDAVKLAGDVGLAVDVLWLVCERQAAERGITDEAFGRSLAGDAIEAAIKVLLEAVADFFPQGQRAILRGLLAKHDQAKTQAEAMATTKLAAVDQVMASMLTQAEGEIDAALGRLSGSLPASPA